MELRTLRYFLAIVDHGSVTAAARHVHIAQPAISRQVQALEAELGVELFLRDGRRLRLSPAGRRLLPIIRDLIARADSARATMTAVAQGDPGAHHRRGASHHDRGRDRAVRRLPRRAVRRRRRSSSPPPMRPTTRSPAPRSTSRSRRTPRRATSPHSWSPGSRSGPRCPRARCLGASRARRSRDAPAAAARRPRPHPRNAPRLRGRGAPHERRLSDGGGGGRCRGSPRRCPHPASGSRSSPTTPRTTSASSTSTARDGPLHISLHAAWDPTHYAAATIREFVTAFTAHTSVLTDGLPAAPLIRR